jgi:hypothetical protein
MSFSVFSIWRPLKNDFVAAKRSFASDDNKAELTLCSYKNMGFSAVSICGICCTNYKKFS